jgi:phage portal protein BeeE
MEWKPLELSEQDKAFQEARDQNTRDIVSMFAITPSMLGVPSKHASQEEYDAAFASVLKEMYGKTACD